MLCSFFSYHCYENILRANLSSNPYWTGFENEGTGLLYSYSDLYSTIRQVSSSSQICRIADTRLDLNWQHIANTAVECLSNDRHTMGADSVLTATNAPLWVTASNHGPLVSVVAWFLAVTAFLAVFARVATRYAVIRQVRQDDVVIVIALV